LDEFKKPHILFNRLLGAIVAHYAEINFGIAIVATRLHFWMYTGLLMVVGYIIPMHGQNVVSEQTMIPMSNYEEDQNSKPRQKSKKNRKRRSQSATPLLGRQPSWMRNTLIAAFIVSLILVSIGYDFISNPDSTTSLKDHRFILHSIANKDNAVSYGV
jgi:hypothetical protein